MRKIKVWDKVEKIMYPFECITSINLYENFVELGEETHGEYTELLWDKQLDFSDCELIESTGLKDKNGKEIYKGDIISTTYPDCTAVVVWEEDTVRYIGYTIENERKIIYVDRVDKHDKPAVEVIGNIYENPELAN